MAYITKDEARLAARARLQKSYGSSATQILREEVRASAAAESFDIFLSHSSEDLIRNLPQRGSPHEFVTH